MISPRRESARVLPGEPRLRFPRRFRVRSGADFGRIYREGQRARGDLMIVVGAPNGLGHPRLGLSVGKRIWKSAVKRNRVRRVFREAFRLAAPGLPALDLVLIPAIPALRPDSGPARAELLRLAARVQEKLARKGDAGRGDGSRPGAEGPGC